MTNNEKLIDKAKKLLAEAGDYASCGKTQHCTFWLGLPFHRISQA